VADTSRRGPDHHLRDAIPACFVDESHDVLSFFDDGYTHGTNERANGRHPTSGVSTCSREQFDGHRESGSVVNLDGGIHEIPLPAPAQGKLWLCGKHAIGPDPEGLMARVGADGVVCLNHEHELAERYPDYVTWLRAQPPDRVVWHPIHDLDAPTLDEFAPVLTDLVDRVAAGDRLIVHCAAGIGRAGTVAVAVLVSLAVPLEEALDRVRRHRPAAGPEVGAQLELVRRLHEQLS
jgi:protein-tyrosine phosphatase